MQGGDDFTRKVVLRAMQLVGIQILHAKRGITARDHQLSLTENELRLLLASCTAAASVGEAGGIGLGTLASSGSLGEASWLPLPCHSDRGEVTSLRQLRTCT